jgi:hypothetical protein
MLNYRFSKLQISMLVKRPSVLLCKAANRSGRVLPAGAGILINSKVLSGTQKNRQRNSSFLLRW